MRPHDFQGDFGRSEATSGKVSSRHLQHPIRLQPILHVIMARHGDELTTRTPDGLGESGTADLGYRTVDHAQTNSSMTRESRFGQSTGQGTRNCSPLDRQRNGRSQAGGDEKTTLDRKVVMSLMLISCGKASTRE